MYLVNKCNICLHVYVDTHILMTVSLLPFKLIKIWLDRIIYTFLYTSSDSKQNFWYHKTRILPKMGNMTLLPSLGKPVFYGMGLPTRVILCQPWSSLFVGKASRNFLQMTKASDFCCDWRFKG